MSFLKKMFASKDPVDEMRQCHAQQDWAGVLLAAKRIDHDTLDDRTSQDINTWSSEAGDALAEINIDEGLWAHRSGNLLRAREDFQLAFEQAKSVEVKERAQKALTSLENGELPESDETTDEKGLKQTGCNTCSPAKVHEESAGTDLDEETRMELLLATMEPELAERYLAAGEKFRKAWIAAQDGDEEEAWKLLTDIPESERDALFLFERGSLSARSGQLRQALKDLQATLTLEPDFFHAFETLVEVLFASKQTDTLEKLLKQSIAEQRFAGYCWAQLTKIHANRGKLEPALSAGLKAIDEGATDPELFVLCAQLLEGEERFGEAEALLQKLPAGGCGGGAHPMLAEYWLRRGQNLNAALESFKGAMRQESDNPRWLLRIAQVYMAKGWHKEAAVQVERLMLFGNLAEPFHSEVKALANELQGPPHKSQK